LVVAVWQSDFDVGVGVGGAEADPGLLQFGPAALVMRIEASIELETCSLGNDHKGDVTGRVGPLLRGDLSIATATLPLAG
jgi:hypothetical protein